MMPATATPQPPSHPTHGPKAFADQVKVVPQSGTARFSSRYAKAMKNMGTNARMNAIGVWNATAAITNPRVATRE
jgi:hypothetical protein